MEVGDMIKLPIGAKTAHDIVSKVAILTEKIPRQDYLEYDWKVFADGRFFEFGRQIEDSAEVLCGREY